MCKDRVSNLLASTRQEGASPSDHKDMREKCSPQVKPCFSVLISLSDNGLCPFPPSHNFTVSCEPRWSWGGLWQTLHQPLGSRFLGSRLSHWWYSCLSCSRVSSRTLPSCGRRVVSIVCHGIVDSLRALIDASPAIGILSRGGCIIWKRDGLFLFAITI